MRVTIERETTVGDLLDEIGEIYGSEEELRSYLREHPQDWDARIALHDYKEYADEPRDKRLEDSREIIIPDTALDELTFRRVKLMLELKQLDGEIEGIRSLSRTLERDVKNVSQDVRALREIGLLDVKEQGPGRPHIVSLPGKNIDLHLLEAEA